MTITIKYKTWLYCEERSALQALQDEAKGRRRARGERLRARDAQYEKLNVPVYTCRRADGTAVEYRGRSAGYHSRGSGHRK